MAAAVIFTILSQKSVYQWLFLLSFPLFIRDLIQISQITEPRLLDPFLKKLSLTTLLFTVLFGVGVLLI